MIILETERLILRRLDDRDAAFMLELMNEPGWLQFIGDRGVRTIDEARDYIRRAVVAMHERHGFSLYCAVTRDAGTPVGLCGLVKRDALPGPDLGFAFLQRWSGKGLAREAARGVVDHARRVLGMPRLLAVTSPDNARSLRLLESLGFRREGRVTIVAGEPELLLMARDADMAQRFRRLWSEAGAAGDPQPVFEDLARRYAEPQRAYHVMDHVEHCLDELDAVRGLASDPVIVELALWFHDAVYDPKAKDNEERSADLADIVAATMGLSQERRAELGRLILATHHHGAPAPGDEALVVDIDLAILGAPRERFDEYERQIRAEYAHVPKLLFDIGRAKILRKFLDRPSIYATPHFRERCEARARENLRRSLG